MVNDEAEFPRHSPMQSPERAARSVLWPAGCSLIFEQHFDHHGQMHGQVMEMLPDARYFTCYSGNNSLLEIRNGVGIIICLVNLDKLLIITPIKTVGPGAA